MTLTVVEKFSKHFSDVQAYAVLDNNHHRIANVTFKRTGASWVCYVHIVGLPLQSGKASGGGYDLQSAAFADAISKSTDSDPVLQDFRAAAAYDDGRNWFDGVEFSGAYRILSVIA